jgi:glycosyltransferase involved in cell wall biosynthesis
MGDLLMVIPSTVRLVGGVYEVERDYANNLRVYLKNFGHVTFACPVSPSTTYSILKSQPITQIEDSARLTYLPLPVAYREDKFFINYFSTRALLKREIRKADYLLFSPHAKYDWSTVAAELAIKMKRKYCMESDYDHRSVSRFLLDTIPFGVKKIRTMFWTKSFLGQVDRCFVNSSIALLQGQDVFEAYKAVAPNPRKVLNVQVSSEDYIPVAELRDKLDKIKRGNAITIAYAGRMVDMKGPLDWVSTVHAVIESEVKLHATWFGDGPLMSEIRREVERLGIGPNVTLAGTVSREDLMRRLRRTDIFLFCHKTGESPRCLSEALAAGCSLVGYGSKFPRDLVANYGGGEFARSGDWKMLASIVVSLNRDRPRLKQLMESASASGRKLDRETAMQERIDLIKRYLA